MRWVCIAEGEQPFLSRKTYSGHGNPRSEANFFCSVYGPVLSWKVSNTRVSYGSLPIVR